MYISIMHVILAIIDKAANFFYYNSVLIIMKKFIDLEVFGNLIKITRSKCFTTNMITCVFSAISISHPLIEVVMKIRQNLGSCSSVYINDIMSEFGHSQINDVISNSAGSIFDLIFTNIPEMISTVSEFPCIFPTDHAVLKFPIFIPKTRHNKKERFVYNYKAAQWNELRAKIVNANLCRVIENTVDVNLTWNGWLDLIEQFMSVTIPRVKVKPNL